MCSMFIPSAFQEPYFPVFKLHWTNRLRGINIFNHLEMKPPFVWGIIFVEKIDSEPLSGAQARLKREWAVSSVL